MKKVLSVAMVALFVAGSSTFAGESCCPKKAEKECSKEKQECTKDSKACSAAKECAKSE
ncbi:hypothetical protein [Pontiella sp.]|uniref:hypothetical protein n=1 Tax=Pontiella sp. TaxID=2837462 RepID=UPI0035617B8F